MRFVLIHLFLLREVVERGMDQRHLLLPQVPLCAGRGGVSDANAKPTDDLESQPELVKLCLTKSNSRRSSASAATAVLTPTECNLIP
jgi:hypothetical protein